MATANDQGSNVKIALITGGSRGLGRATAESLARKGVDVVITYLSRAAAAQEVVAAVQARGRRAVALQLDTSAVRSFGAFADELKRALSETWGRTTFDYLVNNAGTGLHKPVLDTTEAEFDALVNVHLKGVFFLTQKLLPLMADGGRIINVSSGLARVSFPNTAAYAMMKGGIEVFTRSLAKEFGARGITANTVAPGAVATDFNGGRFRDTPDLQRLVSQMTALGRSAVPDDIGPMIASLLADDNRWVNGQRIEVSGGMAL
ncbi:SDR family NAD(P)-dependent oxidoreductase [Frigoriglobus tundricola]|uniref:Oxidoreductase, short-chain dehydrogenase/reductase family n=1 Tax=Frigoriglobus tundricola TaxID=2774151 RepID=A0A6M5YXS3_9BACT|nr:SDR family oxidoreductase [Frigoriglobus tundricola]QJW98294.1 Oxidoreductase, short-chain dehydrogenase/reductase family [Frigoriglobus tundricola]